MIKDEYEKAKKFILVERKANLVNAKKNVKSNFKALRLQEEEISRVKIIEFSSKRDE